MIILIPLLVLSFAYSTFSLRKNYCRLLNCVHKSSFNKLCLSIDHFGYLDLASRINFAFSWQMVKSSYSFAN